MIFFVMALALAVSIELSRSGVIETALTGLIPVFWHFLLVGWITQIIMGVSIWMFPRKKRGEVRGGEKHARVAFYCLNAGLILRAIAEPVTAVTPGFTWVQWTLIFSAVLQVAGGLAYVAGIWPRIKGVRSRRREKKKGGSP